MLKLLDKLMNELKMLSKDVERKDAKYWWSCRSISRNSHFPQTVPWQFSDHLFSYQENEKVLFVGKRIRMLV